MVKNKNGIGKERFENVPAQGIEGCEVSISPSAKDDHSIH
jgi:hypothetical protein